MCPYHGPEGVPVGSQTLKLRRLRSVSHTVTVIISVVLLRHTIKSFADQV